MNNRRGQPRGSHTAIETRHVLYIYAGMLFYFFFGFEDMIMFSRSAMSVSLQLPHMASICGSGGPAA